MIGLQRGRVALCEHQNDWRNIAAETIKEIKCIFGDTALDVQHIGSTAIHDIKSKPIIDIAVGVSSLEGLGDVLLLLEQKGYERRINRFSSDLLHVYENIENNERIRISQIHILIYDCLQWHNYVDFRDYMNAFPEKANEYEALKIELSYRCNDVQTVYTNGKKAYMEKILPEARRYAHIMRNEKQLNNKQIREMTNSDLTD